ncbi:MAG: hypothetical protein IPN18_18030 [Ignavibacteriales bacterium]|nr:hypothetical protein [Ignavibacteriales bacterium]
MIYSENDPTLLFKFLQITLPELDEELINKLKVMPTQLFCLERIIPME